MKVFSVEQEIDYFETFREFADDFDFCETDLLFTERILYTNIIEKVKPSCQILIKDDFSMTEPDEETVDKILRSIEGKNIKRIIAVGGGSVIDIAKAIRIKNAYPFGRILKNEVPIEVEKDLIVVPTTCGTGSEITSGAIIMQSGTGLKTIIPCFKLSSSKAILIPEFISGLPFKVFMHCSMDALGHAMESYLAHGRTTVFSRAQGGMAIELIVNNFVNIALKGQTYQKDCAKDALFASTLAGIGMTNSNCGPVHALAYPLGEVYHMSHGEGIYEFLIPVMNLYQKKDPNGDLLVKMKNILIPILKQYTADVDKDNVFSVLEEVLNKVYPKRPLHECGMSENDIVPFADTIMETKMRLVSTGFTDFTKQDAIDIFTAGL